MVIYINKGICNLKNTTVTTVTVTLDKKLFT